MTNLCSDNEICVVIKIFIVTFSFISNEYVISLYRQVTTGFLTSNIVFFLLIFNLVCGIVALMPICIATNCAANIII